MDFLSIFRRSSATTLLGRDLAIHELSELYALEKNVPGTHVTADSSQTQITNLAHGLHCLLDTDLLVTRAWLYGEGTTGERDLSPIYAKLEKLDQLCEKLGINLPMGRSGYIPVTVNPKLTAI